MLKEVVALKHLNHNPHYQCSHWTDLSQQMWVTLPVLLSLLHFRPHQFPLQFHFHLNNLLSIPDLLHYLQLYLPDLVYCLSTSLLSSSLCKTFVHMILVHSPFWSYNVIILCGITTALKCRHFSQLCSRCCSSFFRSPDLKLWSFGPWHLVLGSSGPSKNSSPGKIWHHQTPWPQAMKSLMPCKWAYYHCKIIGTV